VKGNLLYGDEKAYPAVSKQHVATHIGDSLQESIPLRQIIAEVQRRYHFFFIFPRNASHGSDEDIQNFWRNLLGQHVIFLDDENAVSETIALTIGLTEDAINLAEGEKDLNDVGAGHAAIDAAKKALQNYATGKDVATTTGGNLPGLTQKDTGTTPKTERL
jgi:hypothetical protein